MTTTIRAGTQACADESWPMVEEAVFRLFDEIAASGEHAAIGPRLAELGWADIASQYPRESDELLFRAQGKSLAHTDCLNTVTLAELDRVVALPVAGVVFPVGAAAPASSGGQVSGVVLGALTGQLVVPVTATAGAVSIALVDADRLTGHRLDTFDPSVHWTQVSGNTDAELVDASVDWARALGAAQRALATELVALADAALRIAIEHVSAREQFGAPIGSFQAPRHLLADAAAGLEGARAVLAQAWRHGDELSTLAAKVAAGRAHRAVADATMQTCGAIGLTAEHPLHRYVRRGFTLDVLCGSPSGLEGLLAERLFDHHPADRALPSLVSWD